MKILKLYGASDDCIEIEGELDLEFSYQEENDKIIFPDGTIAGIEYADEGMWKITILEKGYAAISLHEATDIDTDYSDILTLSCEHIREPCKVEHVFGE